ncbi:MAG: Serine/threonine protein kinase [Myxococcaceae bacterium]|nr:Serine/threonine protein kinase [Myxococcaceae bacterium]
MRPVANESKIPTGTLLVAKYRVTREIGRGGMAAVYEAEHTSLGKKVAVKVLAAELSASSIVIERFFREARAAASVKSPYIVDIYDSGRLEDGRPFICMEMLEGESLYDRMARIRLIDPDTTVRVIAQCAKGLMKAHAVGIVHRDLKPENIFITKSEEGEEIAKLLDFGLAKFYAPVAADEKTARLTREGAVFGTPAYMSPEQVKGQGSVDHRADLWALGCMAFECLIGRPVWNTDQGVAMTFAAIATNPIPIPSKLRPDLPNAFDEWFKKALERDPDRRFQSAKELADALQRAFGTPSVSLVNAHDLGDIEARANGNHLVVQTPTTVMSPGTGPIELSRARSPAAGAAGGSPLAASASGQISALNADGSVVRSVNVSAADLPPTAQNSQVTTSQLVQLPPSPLRWVLSSVALVAASVIAFIVYSNVLRPQVFTPVVQSTATAAPREDAGNVENPTPVDEPKWATLIADGQKLFTAGDIPSALRKFKESQDMGGGIIAKAFFDQVKIAETAPGGRSCKMIAFGHPRVGIPGAASRPAVSMIGKGALVTWTDDHEQAGHDHAYAAVVDETGHLTSRQRDLTPEATEVMRPSLLTVADRAVLLYWDKSGRAAGVHVRWIDADGRIGGPAILVGGSKPGNYWPSMDKAPDGFYVAWQDDRDREGDDIFFRKLNPDLGLSGPEIRTTDYVSVARNMVNARVPSVAIASNTLFIAYKLEREPAHTIMRMRLPLGGPELSKGLDERTTPGAQLPKGSPDRELGDVAIVNEDKLPADAPAIACGPEGCFLAWHGEKGGAYAALIEPVEGRVLWRKKLGDKAGHPSLGVNGDGVAVTYFEAGRVKLAPLTRDGVGASSVIAKVTGDQPRPFLASGRAKGEWYLAWQDFEAGHTEAYVARIACAAGR